MNINKLLWSLKVLVTPDCWFTIHPLDRTEDDVVWTELENGCVFDDIQPNDEFHMLFNGVPRIVDVESNALGSSSYGRCLRRRTRARFIDCLNKRHTNNLNDNQCKRMFNGMTYKEVRDILSNQTPEKLL